MTRNGFTLIEMLVALSLFAIAALALARLDAFTVSTTAQLRDNSMARLVAENEAALVISAPRAPDSGDEQFERRNGGQLFMVSRSASATPDPRLRRIDILVTPMSGGSPARLTLVRRTDR
ncbi:type II secretion system minor pseudopilin GspI [Sphingomicrobium lutaoense]|uniref:Type II secretion system protein I n=1 Tax=Sphingomicrobium lutaoense TaxID=515949 RepID=A0A839Z2X4_9SPHN|nr:type II secretion system minor pseudopilin GspI [Sphingomicrobium lutaoense]MBB3764898.1 general secretion pathway protein I [Sphingomicrobium lutaoense]